MYNKEFQERKKEIIKLHKQGLDINEIKRLTNTHFSVIKKIIERDISKEGFFNVNKLDCWLVPSPEY